jgi:hypothetical protein
MKKWLKTWRTCSFEKIKSFSFQLTKHNWFEAQAGRFDDSCNTVLDISFRATTRQSHAGVELIFLIMRWHLELRIYDIRHWDYANECYEDEKVSLKSWLIEGCKVGPVKMELDAEMLIVTNKLCGFVDKMDESEIKEELPPAEITRLEDRLSSCYWAVVRCRRENFTHTKQDGE